MILRLCRRLAFYKPRPLGLSFSREFSKRAIGVGLPLVRSPLAALIKVVDSFVAHENQSKVNHLKTPLAGFKGPTSYCAFRSARL